MVADVGQGEDLQARGREGLRHRREQSGSWKICAKNFCGLSFPALKAGAVYEGKYLLGNFAGASGDCEASGGSGAARGRDAVAHGCTGKGNDQVRFELTYQALAPELKIIAPWREWSLKSREDASITPKQHGPWREPREDSQPRPQRLAHQPRRRRTGRCCQRSVAYDVADQYALAAGRAGQRRKSFHRLRTRDAVSVNGQA
jgi:argininosuccinate synthase